MLFVSAHHALPPGTVQQYLPSLIYTESGDRKMTDSTGFAPDPKGAL